MRLICYYPMGLYYFLLGLRIIRIGEFYPHLYNYLDIYGIVFLKCHTSASEIKKNRAQLYPTTKSQIGAFGLLESET